MKIKKRHMDKTEKFVFIFLAIIGLVVFYSLSKAALVLFQNPNTQPAGDNVMTQKLSKMALTSFDRELAKEFMDKNKDGKCDSCGMPVEMCIDSGQLQCNMDPKSTIGVLGSQHIHADWKIYINSKPLDDAILESLSMDMSKTDNNISSSFIHMDKGAPTPEKTGDIIHMHATGVPLWLFFKSVGMEFNKECLILPDQQRFCNNEKNSLKFYVNNKPNPEFENYVFKDQDKILISFDPKDEDITKQLSSITNFAGVH